MWLLLLLTLLQGRYPVAEKIVPITVDVNPRQCFEPCSFNVTLTIPRQPDNRYAVIEVDGPQFRSTQFTINGMEGPRLIQQQYQNFPGGEYVVKGVIYNTTREYYRSERKLIIVGRE